VRRQGIFEDIHQRLAHFADAGAHGVHFGTPQGVKLRSLSTVETTCAPKFGGLE
jgi:hypothetical protein